MREIQIVPIILATTLKEFDSQFNKIIDLSDRINIDLADGIVAPNTTLSILEIINYLYKKEEKLKNKILDFDLMIKNWQPIVKELDKHQRLLNTNLIFVHKAYYLPHSAINFKIGIALDDDDEVRFSKLRSFPAIQIMTIELGFQGSSFIPESLGKIQELRNQGYAGEIIIDGSVNDQTLPIILSQKELPDVLGVGSYFTQAKNPELNFQKLEKMISSFFSAPPESSL